MRRIFLVSTNATLDFLASVSFIFVYVFFTTWFIVMSTFVVVFSLSLVLPTLQTSLQVVFLKNSAFLSFLSQPYSDDVDSCSSSLLQFHILRLFMSSCHPIPHKQCVSQLRLSSPDGRFMKFKLKLDNIVGCIPRGRQWRRQTRIRCLRVLLSCVRLSNGNLSESCSALGANTISVSHDSCDVSAFLPNIV